MGCLSSKFEGSTNVPDDHAYAKSNEKFSLPVAPPPSTKTNLPSEPKVISPPSSYSPPPPTPPPAPSPSPPALTHAVSMYPTYLLSSSTPQVFKMKDIRIATENFSDAFVLGEGGFGKVYKGYFSNENGETVKVAIKRLNPESHQGQQEWLAEILILGRVSHPNLVKFHGYCSEEGEGILVYEYVPLGSLDYHLFSVDDPNDNSGFLSWETRLKIAHGTASGLAFLHENNVIHRDFKAPNILLDANYKPLITDFGLAKIADAGETHVSTRIMGTLGYLDPKYMETGQLTKKSDVYSFGVMLLELISGRRAMRDNMSITSWASKYLNDRRPDVEKILDPLILPTVSSRTMQRIAQKLVIAARHCVEDDPIFRPQMSDIVDTLTPLLNMVQNAEGSTNGN